MENQDEFMGLTVDEWDMLVDDCKSRINKHKDHLYACFEDKELLNDIDFVQKHYDSSNCLEWLEGVSKRFNVVNINGDTHFAKKPNYQATKTFFKAAVCFRNDYSVNEFFDFLSDLLKRNSQEILGGKKVFEKLREDEMYLERLTFDRVNFLRVLSTILPHGIKSDFRKYLPKYL